MSFWIFTALFAAVIYLVNQYFFSYWSKRGIPFKKPIFVIGDLGNFLINRKSFGEYFQEIYNKYKNNRIYGLFFSYRPTLIINDPEIVQEIMIKNFTSFTDRGFPVDEETDPLVAHLFSLTGQRWRNLRVKLSPTFTSGKLKGMYPTIHSCGKVLQEYIGRTVEKGDDVFDIRDLMARFTTNVISSVAFGIENDSINDRENIFRKMGIKIFTRGIKQAVLTIFLLFIPKVITSLNLKIKRIPQDIEDFFMTVVRQTIDHREKNKDFERKDFMQLLIQLKNQGYVSADKENLIDENNSEVDTKHDMKKLTFNEVAAQSFLFFIAGLYINYF